MGTVHDDAAMGAALDRVLAVPPARPLHVELLGGGYSWLTYRVAGADGRVVIARVAPRGGTMEPYDPAWEATVLSAARDAVPAPDVLAVEQDPGVLGAPFSVQSEVPGRVLRLSEVGDEAERAAYRQTFARTLGALHRDGDASALGCAVDIGQASSEELARTVEHYVRSAATRHPGFEVGLRWLCTHRPRLRERPRLCHGDFRFHNLAWTGVGQLGGVLDWERAWCGDPMADVAFTELFSGWCAVDGDAVAIYERAAGLAVDPARVSYGRRFEVVRSHTSGMRALRALADGRADRWELYGIGEAGQVGLWSLVAWLRDGPLDPLPVSVDLPPDYVAPLPPDRLAALRAALPPGSPLAEHLDALQEADGAAVRASVQALRAAPAPGDVSDRLRRALSGADAERAWARAYAVLVPAAAVGGADLVAALQALGLRFTRRPVFLKGRIAA